MRKVKARTTKRWPFSGGQSLLGLVSGLLAVALVLIGMQIGSLGAKNPIYASTVQATERLAVASVSPLASDSSSWYCNWYLPAQGGLTQASVLLANTSAKDLSAKVKIYSGTSTVNRRLEIPAHSFLKYPQTVTPKIQSGSLSFIANGGGTVAEIELSGPSGSTVAPCNSSPSANWIAVGANTLPGSSAGVSIFNPFSQDAVVDVSLSSSSQQFSPGALKAMVINPNQSKLVNLSQYFSGHGHVVVSVTTRIGRVVVGGIIQRDNNGNTGLAALATFPTTASTWRFPVGQLSANQNQEIIVYNPNSYEVNVVADFAYLDLKQVPSVSTTSTTSTTAAPAAKAKKGVPKGTTTTKVPAGSVPKSSYRVKQTIQPGSLGVISVKANTSIQPGISYRAKLVVKGGHGVVSAEAFLGSANSPNLRYQVVGGIPLTTQHWIALFDPSSIGLSNVQAWLATVDNRGNDTVAQKTPLVDLGPTYLAPPGKTPAALPIIQAQTAPTSKSVIKSPLHLHAVGALTSSVTGVIISSKSAFAIGTVMGPSATDWYVVPVLPFAN